MSDHRNGAAIAALEDALLEEQRRNEWHKSTIDRLHAEVNRLRGLVGEPLLCPDIWLGKYADLQILRRSRKSQGRRLAARKLRR